jgi:superfamily II DNA or RNA helicase
MKKRGGVLKSMVLQESSTIKTRRHSNWGVQNSDLFPEKTDIKLSEILKDKESNLDNYSFELQNHQIIGYKYLSPHTPYRGCLLYHGLGSGKTCSSIAIAEGLKIKRKVIILSPASLENNYRDELKKCGSDYYIESNKWIWVREEETDKKLKKEMEKVPESVRRVNKGCWVTDFDLEEKYNFKNKTEEDKVKIRLQINLLVDFYYSFIHYDGLRNENMREFENLRILDNKTVIVDEAHNLISRMTGGGSQGALWYNLMMKSKNTRFIFLSGTPIVNSPYELGLLFNILRGPIKVFSYSCKKENFDAKELETHLKKFKYVDFVKVNPIQNSFKVTKPEDNFTVDENGNVKNENNENTNLTSQNWFLKLTEHVLEVGYTIDPFSQDITEFENFPTDQILFDNLFLDKENNTIINKEIFSRRILGLVSYFKPSQNKSDFPTILNENIIKLPMSRAQYLAYETVRLEEIDEDAEKFSKSSNKKEKTNLRKKINDALLNNANNHESSKYRIFSRATCNFSYPDVIFRPTKKQLNKTLEQLKYEATDQLTSYLEDIPKKNLDLEVKNMSPKYFEIQKNIENSPGTCLVYTVLRHMEGISAFTKILNAYGWQELKIRKEGTEWRVSNFGEKTYALYSGTESKEIRDIARLIYNNEWKKLPKSIQKDLEEADNNTNLHGEILKVLIITKAGAEGITCRNIRQIHVTESHWNNVRTQQVIGRGVRYKSHEDLPENERNVEIYRYVSVFGETVENMKKDDRFKITIENLQRNDKGQTSDEHVFNVAELKTDFIDQMLNILKETSFDCAMNKNDNAYSCIDLGNANEFAYEPSLNDHIDNYGKKTKLDRREMTILKIDHSQKKYLHFPTYLDGKTVLWDKESESLYEYNEHIYSYGVIKGRKIKIGVYNGKIVKRLR